MRKLLLTGAMCAASLVILLGGYFCFAPFWQPEYAPVSSEDFDAAELFRVDLNTADAEELQSLPGLGEGTAQAIIDYRDWFGDFIIVDQLVLVEGVSQNDVDQWREFLYIK